MTEHDRMSWTERFYSETGRWWGNAESGITERDHRRVATLERLAGPGRKRVLELGSSYGNTAAAFAAAGHDVVGIEISDRIAFANRHVAPAQGKRPTFVRGDFYQEDVGGSFDAVCYWNGFGIGSDADQRRLLRRIAQDWLSPDGVALIDIANPSVWIGWTGNEHHLSANPDAGYPFDVVERHDYDPIHNRCIDTWWRADRPAERFSQMIRCYSPADLLLLLEGTGLNLGGLEVNGVAIDLRQSHNSAHPLWSAHEYLAILSQGMTIDSSSSVDTDEEVKD